MAMGAMLLLLRVAGACAALASTHVGIVLVVAPPALRQLFDRQGRHLIQIHCCPPHLLLHMLRWRLLQLVQLQRPLTIAAAMAGCVARPTINGGAWRCAAPSRCSFILPALLLLPLWQ